MRRRLRELIFVAVLALLSCCSLAVGPPVAAPTGGRDTNAPFAKYDRFLVKLEAGSVKPMGAVDLDLDSLVARVHLQAELRRLAQVMNDFGRIAYLVVQTIRQVCPAIHRELQKRVSVTSPTERKEARLLYAGVYRHLEDTYPAHVPIKFADITQLLADTEDVLERLREHEPADQPMVHLHNYFVNRSLFPPLLLEKGLRLFQPWEADVEGSDVDFICDWR